MPSTAQDTSRTPQLLALMNAGDVAFNARDLAAVDAVHHPDMIAYITGSAEPIHGRTAHAAAMAQLVRIFPDVHVHLPYPVQFGSGDWITVVTRATGTFTGEMKRPDGTVIPPTGKAFDLEFGQTSRWDGDRLIVISAFWDSALQARQLGLA
jgi:hypothetical protein